MKITCTRKGWGRKVNPYKPEETGFWKFEVDITELPSFASNGVTELDVGSYYVELETQYKSPVEELWYGYHPRVVELGWATRQVYISTEQEVGERFIPYQADGTDSTPNDNPESLYTRSELIAFGEKVRESCAGSVDNEYQKNNILSVNIEDLLTKNRS